MIVCESECGHVGVWAWACFALVLLSFMLGTDVSGGYSASMWEVMRQAIIASTCYHLNDTKYQPLSYKEAFHLATVGGSEVCLHLSPCLLNSTPSICLLTLTRFKRLLAWQTSLVIFKWGNISML